MAQNKTKEQKEKESLEMSKAKFDRWWSNAESSRKKIDWKWFIYDLWVNGNHYATYDKDTQQIVTTVRDKGKPKIVINKIYTTLRAVRNYVLRNKPRAEVTPENLSEENIKEARIINKYLDFIHDKLRLTIAEKATVWHALKYSVGYWQVLWNDNADNGKGEVSVSVIDPYDLYVDPNATSIESARYVILAVRRSLFDLKNDEKYDSEEVQQIKGDNKVSASSLKARLINSESGLTPSSQYDSDKEGGTVIVKEIWYKEPKDNGEFRIMLSTMAGDRIIRKPIDTGLSRIPFFCYSSDIEPLSLYGTGWVKNLIPVNRMLNRLESSLAEYNDIINKGKWITDKNSGVRVVNNEHGQIITKKRGYDITPAPIPSLSGAIYQQISSANRYIEDIGGAHDASMGRIPAGASSGRALEALQVGDANNMSELVDNLEVFLEDVYEYILQLASENYLFVRNISPTNFTGEREFMQIIGENATNKPPEATVINRTNIVDVKITSWLAMTTLAKQEILKELYQLGVIDKQTVLDGYQIGDVADILARVQQEQEQQMASELASKKIEEQTNAPEQGQAQAIAVIRSIIQDQPVPRIGQVTEDFINYFDQFLQSEEAQRLDNATLQAIQGYRDNAVQQVQTGGNNAIQ